MANMRAALVTTHRQHPELSRLMRWEGLTFDEVPDEQLRREYYGYKESSHGQGQRQGAVSIALESGSPDLSGHSHWQRGWWSAVPRWHVCSPARRRTGTCPTPGLCRQSRPAAGWRLMQRLRQQMPGLTSNVVPTCHPPKTGRHGIQRMDGRGQKALLYLQLGLPVRWLIAP